MLKALSQMVVALLFLGLTAGSLQAAPAQDAEQMDPAMKAMMEKMMQYGSPGQPHEALEPLAGNWNYTGQWRMSPEEPFQAMSGTATNRLIYGGRFLQQEVSGKPEAEGQPPFEGLGFTGYDNLRKEYQSVWIDNMITGMMWGTGKFDVATQTLRHEGKFSCPVTGESHRWYRSAWKVADPDHMSYESFSRTPEGEEYQSLEIQYSRAQ